MIVCLRTVGVPAAERERYLAWIAANRTIRQQHGILFELVLDRSPGQNPAKASQPPPSPAATGSALGLEAVVVTAWPSHEALDAWTNTPDRDRLTASPVHQAVTFGPITRYDVTGGYLNLDGLHALAAADVADTREEQP